MGVDGLANGNGLGHHFFINAQATRGINDNDVDAVRNRIVKARASYLNRIADTITGLWRPDLNARTLTNDLQLTNRIGALEVRSNEQDRLAFFAQPLSKLSGQSRLTRTLQTSEHEDCGTALSEVELSGFTTKNLDQFVVNDSNDLLTRIESTRASGTIGLLANLRRELADNGQCDVGIQECASNLADGLINIRLGQYTARTQLLKRRCQTIRQIRESHCDYSSRAQKYRTRF